MLLGSLSRRRRTIAVAAGALTLLVAGTPFLPNSDQSPPAIQPRSSEAGPPLTTSVGAGRVTPAMQAEIERVVAEGMSTPRTVALRRTTSRPPARAARCSTGSATASDWVGR
ncbi:hypothetical protein [Nocardioides sp. B-3]|uniref:hypothetical protein n=1 Tax=Nocardioides sp. B-3 TaxID=2895565 RepID=UPI0021531C36|nr:hypothetical protein [Nocardioides sp. B-3]UUZ61347.1 hypothetical protein LP418_12655 [Nocardioides sp. B-3]